MISEEVQLQAVNIVLGLLPRAKFTLPASQCRYLADCLGAVRDRCATAQMPETYALDDIIAALRRGLAPPKSDCARL